MNLIVYKSIFSRLLNKRLLAILAGFVVLNLGGCGGGSDVISAIFQAIVNTMEENFICPISESAGKSCAIKQTSPQNHEYEVSLDSTIQIELNSDQPDFDKSSINSTTIRLEKVIYSDTAFSKGKYEPFPIGSIIVEGKSLKVIPGKRFEANTDYRFSLLEGVRLDGGNKLVSKPLDIKFMTVVKQQYASTIPEPKGSYGIGTFAPQTQSDFSRLTAGEPRHLAFQIWYPTDIHYLSQRAAYLERKLDRWMVSQGVTRSSLAEGVRTNSRFEQRSQCSNGGFPVLLFSPEWGELPQSYHHMIEGLVSQGYVVVGVHHPNVTLATPSSNGIIPLGQHYPKTPEEILSSIKANTEDLQAVLDSLRTAKYTFLNSNCLDLQHIGVLGHGLGGATAIEAIKTIQGVTAGVNLDGAAEESQVQVPPQRPLLIIESNDTQHASNVSLWNNISNGVIRTRLKTQGRYAFSDEGLMPGLMKNTQYPIPTNSTETANSHENVISLTKAFFDNALKGKTNSVKSSIPKTEFAEYYIKP